MLGLGAGLLFAAAALPTIAPSSDVWEYAQEARQIARGEGFTSLYTYPTFLDRESSPAEEIERLGEPRQAAPFPVVWRMPLYAAMGAGLLGLGVPLPAGFLYLGALAHALLVGFSYWLGTLLRSSRAGSVAALCAVACPLFLDAYNPGLSHAHAAALGLVAWVLLLSSRGGPGAALAALPAAAAWYLRSESMVFLPMWLWMATLPSREAIEPEGERTRRAFRPGRAVAFLATYAALCIPWVLAVPEARDGFSLPSRLALLYSQDYPGHSSWRMVGVALPGPIVQLLEHPGYAAFRYARNVFGYVLDLIHALGPVGVGLAIAGLAIRRPRMRIDYRNPVAPLFFAILIQILALSAIHRAPRFLVPVTPLACVFAGLLAIPVLEAVGSRRGVLAIVTALLLERGGSVAFQRADTVRRNPALGEGTVAQLAEKTRAWTRDAVVLTDLPDWLAWHLDRPALFLPLMNQLEPATQRLAVAGMWLSPDARARNAADRDSAWIRAIDRGGTIPGFLGPEILDDGSRLYARAP